MHYCMRNTDTCTGCPASVFRAALYAYYTVSQAPGGNGSTAWNPDLHKNIGLFRLTSVITRCVMLFSTYEVSAV